MEDIKNKAEEPVLSNAAIPKVTGIDGIFFFSDKPDETRAWYANNLGLEVNEWGSTFESRNINRPEEINSLQWSPFLAGSDYFALQKKNSYSTTGFRISKNL